jgi:hypothetical protein
MPSAKLLLLAVLFPTVVLAQTMPNHHHDDRSPAPISHPAEAIPVQPGQGAFAAIQEIVEILEADKTTDWSKVNIDALRRHLVDMDNVTLHAEVENRPVTGGMEFVVQGSGPVRDSIQRMLMAHAATMDGVGGWHLAASATETGAILTVKAPASDLEKLRALGLFGVLAEGMHHQMHHLAIARGGMMHD